ncbi:bifunctional diguanylate cyclase/phosphodiesterase [Pseudoalteromonas sp. T1lg10]|uniref:bifunctional diguanylate cyclase/phosphodiesterase n=1 Tax=Pseudoalteromonas sp. T1lg10 TaxID=2077093 RepID=UPI000CF66E3E|nr:EAL domain-containing protein [Pseudoalteromonas sp. T1lg10]
MTQSFNALYQTSSSEQAYELALSMIDQVFAAKYCFVGRLSDDGLQVRTLAFHSQGQVLDNIEYELESTPCADAICSVDVCIYQDQVAALFPHDAMLNELGIKAYLGMTMRDVSRRPIGILVAMFEQPQNFSAQSLQWFQDLAFIVAAQARHEIDIERKNAMLAELSLRNIVFEQSKEAIMITDAENKILRVNPAFEFYTGYHESELLGRSPGLLASGRHDQQFYANMWQQLHTHGHWRGEVYNRRKTGEVYPEELSITVNRDEQGEISHYIGLFRDISDWKESERQLRFYASQEPLTGLHNRRSFLERVEQHISLHHDQNTPSSLLFLNLDRFKDINDLYGPEVGDKVLVAVALRLQHCVVSSDVLSRYGGDEFTLLLANSTKQQAYACAQRILTHVCQPVRLGELNIELSCSLGIAHIDEQIDSATVFVRNANHAMLSAKRTQSQSIAIYSDEIEGQYLRKIQLRDKLAKALKANELTVAYQPIVNFRSGKIIKFEALARWHDAELGTIDPEEFIVIAEEFGLISQLGQFVLQRALADLSTLHKRGYPHICLSVNRSVSEFNQLLQPVEAILAALHEHQIATHQLTIEVTESVAIGVQQVQDQLNILREQGVKVALDDFCTGYSSLSHLIDLRADYLKIDKSFTHKLLSEHKHQVVIASLINIASELDMEVIAEGVDCADQHQQLHDYGCHFSQGYYYSKPVSLPQALALLEQADSFADTL